MVKRLVSMFACIGLLVSMPGTVTAQDEPTGLGGVDWTLTGYVEDGLMTSAPIGVDATLRLEEGTASGSGGCNAFSGGYELEGDSLTFDDALTRTLRACIGDAAHVEDVYLTSLLEVSEWGIVDGELRLSDGSEMILTFELPGGDLTSADLAQLLDRLDGLEADLSAVDKRVDNISIGKLRERLRNLEADNKNLKAQIADLRRQPPVSSVSAFNNAEKVLLEAVPARIASRCQPLRSGLPSGTAAAVRCSPNTSTVSDMAYYLLDKAGAVKLYDKHMKGQGLEPTGELPGPDATGCWEGNPGYGFAPGGYVGGIGCYVKDGQANLRIIHQATDCKQLKVGTKQLKRPVMYVALDGPDDDILSLYEWALRGKDNLEISGLVEDIARPVGKSSPNCFG